MRLIVWRENKAHSFSHLSRAPVSAGAGPGDVKLLGHFWPWHIFQLCLWPPSSAPPPLLPPPNNIVSSWTPGQRLDLAAQTSWGRTIEEEVGEEEEGPGAQRGQSVSIVLFSLSWRNTFTYISPALCSSLTDLYLSSWSENSSEVERTTDWKGSISSGAMKIYSEMFFYCIQTVCYLSKLWGWPWNFCFILAFSTGVPRLFLFILSKAHFKTAKN